MENNRSTETLRYSGIGGQAVMEGVMMKNGGQYAVAVRKPDQEIAIKVSDCGGEKFKALRKVPFLRGIFNFGDSLVLGMSALSYSASFFEEEEESEKRKAMTEEQKKRSDRIFMGTTMALSVVLALLIFFALPYFLSTLLRRGGVIEPVIVLTEGILRIGIFIGYIALISQNGDMKRLFMYHGAEHKCINCVEHGLDLTVENVKKSSKEHKRCGTSFLIVVMLLSIVLFMFIRVDQPWLQLLFRLLLIPVIAGISYEFLRLAGRKDNVVINVMSRPGIWMQKLTTKEPDDDMIRVGIASVEAVFDWKDWQNKG